MTGEHNIRDELYAATAKHRIWIARLRSLPDGVFDLIVRRLVQGDSQLTIAKWLSELNSAYSFHSYRRYLSVLNADIQSLLAAKKEAIETQVAIDARRDKLVEDEIRKNTSYRPPESPSTAAYKRLDETVDEQVMNLDAERMLRYAWVTQQRRVDSMVAMEQQMGFLHPAGSREMDVLKNIASELMKFDLLHMTLTRKFGRGDTSEITVDKANILVQNFAALDDVDRHLAVQIVEKFKRYAAEEVDAIKAEELGIDESGTAGAPAPTDTGSTPEDVSSGT